MAESEEELKSLLNIHRKDWCWSWNSNTLATWYKELTHLKRPWCWERLKAGGEGDDRGWHGWMASPTQWTWVWLISGFGDGQEGLVCCGSLGRKELDMTERLNWTEGKVWEWSSLVHNGKEFWPGWITPRTSYIWLGWWHLEMLELSMIFKSNFGFRTNARMC